MNSSHPALHSQSMERLALADSMLVTRKGGVPSARGCSLHLQRFAKGLHAIGVTADTSSFMTPSLHSIHEYTLETGDSFPRFECWEHRGSFRLALNLRTAPQRSKTITLVSRERTRITTPQLKGPNIDAYSSLIHDASSEVLLTAHGNAIEGTTTSLIWWDNDTLMTLPDTGSSRVFSITEQLILALAAEDHQRVGVSSQTPHHLANHEVWAINALHGIRPVTAIDGITLPAPQEERLQHWRERLNQTWEPVMPA